MNKFMEIKNAVLKESETDNKLKNYFKKMINLVGEEYTLVSLSQYEGLKDSVSRFSFDFEDTSDDDLAFSLLKGAILSNGENNCINLVREFIKNGELEDLLFISKTNLGFRRELTRAFMQTCYESFQEAYSKRDSEKNQIGDLLSLKYFEESLNKKKEQKNVLLAKGSI